MREKLYGLEFERKASEGPQRLEISITGVRSDGVILQEDSTLFDDQEIKTVVNLTKRKRLTALLSGVFDYQDIPDRTAPNPEEDEETFKITRQAYLTTRILEKCGAAFPEDAPGIPVPKVMAMTVHYADGTGIYPLFSYPETEKEIS